MQCLAFCARLVFTGLLAIAVPRAFAAEAANLLTNSGAEEDAGAQQSPPGWFAALVPATGLRMWRDTDHSRAGDACLAIANEHDYDQTVSNNWLQEVPKFPAGKTVRLSAYLRTDDAEAANVCVQCWAKGGGQMIGFVSTPVFRGTHGWTRVEADELTIPAGTARLMVRAALTGKGKAYFDDLSLDIVDNDAAVADELVAQVSGRIVRRLPVTADTMILAYLPRWNHGHVDNIGIDNNDGGVRTLVAWQPLGHQEISQPNVRFLLAMYSRDTKLRNEPTTIGIHEVRGGWNESTSWQNQPSFAEESAGEHAMTAGEGWKLFDVTSLVRRQVESPGSDHGVMLRFAEERRAGARGDWSGYALVSREGTGEW
ncbi:MAG TPA: DNRLRE domain-containing protein, partial [Pirellulales bacterium]|nr:DNRLRE domain-containing protein [Pirellulales bacterium]